MFLGSRNQMTLNMATRRISDAAALLVLCKLCKLFFSFLRLFLHYIFYTTEFGAPNTSVFLFVQFTLLSSALISMAREQMFNLKGNDINNSEGDQLMI
jgi:hypothetical protein